MTETRCPRAACGFVFAVDERELGRGVRCGRCGSDFTARPEALWRVLLRREERVRAGDFAAAAPSSESDPRRRRRYLYHPAPDGSFGAADHAREPMYEASIDVEAPRAAPVDIVAVLDDVRSQWNVGAIFRTADAAGLAGLALAGITPTPPAKMVVKTALGAQAYVPWTYHARVVQVLEAAACEGREVVALELGGGATSLFDFEPAAKTTLVLGNEVAGVSVEALALCTRRIFIPMAGRKGSLNVAVAFGVAAFALAARWRAGLLSGRRRVPADP